jgi:hypothetical protein
MNKEEKKETARVFLKVNNGKIIVVFVFTKLDILFVFLGYSFLKVNTTPFYPADERFYAFFAQTSVQP